MEKERTEAHVTGCERCAAVRQEVAAEREALRATSLPAVRGRASREAGAPAAARLRLPLVLSPRRGAGAGGGDALVLRPADTDTGAPQRQRRRRQLFVQDATRGHELAAGDAGAEGARLLLSLQPGEHKRVAAVLIESSEASVIYTAGG